MSIQFNPDSLYSEIFDSCPGVHILKNGHPIEQAVQEAFAIFQQGWESVEKIFTKSTMKIETCIKNGAS